VDNHTGEYYEKYWIGLYMTSIQLKPKLKGKNKLKGDMHQFVVLTDATQAGGSLTKGGIELMTHRNSISDDGR
jgi:hypothetical protein